MNPVRQPAGRRNVLVAEMWDRAAAVGRRVRLMEVCGTHTMVAFRSGLRALLPENVSPGVGAGLSGLRDSFRLHRRRHRGGPPPGSHGYYIRGPGAGAGKRVIAGKGASRRRERAGSLFRGRRVGSRP